MADSGSHATPQILSETVPADIQTAGAVAELDRQKLLYCERFTELLIDLLSQLPTRRFVRTLLEDKAILIKCRMSPLLEHPQGECLRTVLHCQCCSMLPSPEKLHPERCRYVTSVTARKGLRSFMAVHRILKIRTEEGISYVRQIGI